MSYNEERCVCPGDSALPLVELKDCPVHASAPPADRWERSTVAFMQAPPPHDDDAAGWKAVALRRGEEYNRLADRLTEAWAELETATARLSEVEAERDRIKLYHEAALERTRLFEASKKVWLKRAGEAQREAKRFREIVEEVAALPVGGGAIQSIQTKASSALVANSEGDGDAS